MGESAMDDGRVRRSSAWLIIGYGGAQVLRFLSNVILSRLLYEEAFGLMAIVSSVLQALELFSDLGVRPAIIRSERQDQRFLNTAWSVEVLRAALLAGVALLVTPAIADFYDAPELLYLLPIAIAGSFITALSSTKMATETRNLNLRRVEIVTLSTQFTTVAVMIGWAMVSPTVTALAAGSVAGAVVHVLMSHLYLPGPVNRLFWDKEAAREVVVFGRWIVLSTMIHFLGERADRLIFGTFISMDELGVFHMGAVLASLPSLALARFSYDVFFPVYSQIYNDGGDVHDVLDGLRRPVFAVAAWALCGLTAGGPAAVQLVYDERYWDAGTVAQLLSVAGWASLMGTNYAALFLAAGAPKWIAVGNAIRAVTLMAGVPLGFIIADDIQPGWGFNGALVGLLASNVAYYFALAALCARKLGVRGGTLEAAFTLRLVLVAVPVSFVDSWFERLETPIVLRCAIIFVAVTAAWWPVLWPYVRGRLEAWRGAKAP